jgi:hypothetical protein
MKANIKDRFIRNLQFGGYRKGRGSLKYVTTRGNLCHCALGVLAEMYEYDTNGRQGKFREVKLENIPVVSPDIPCSVTVSKLFSILGETSTLPPKILDWAGISEYEASQIFQLNDESDHSKSYASVVKYLKTL